MLEIDDLWGSWFAGFTDGEGCFSIRKAKRNNPCTSYVCRFRINLRDDDRAILEEIRKTLGIGIIYDVPVYPNRTANARPATALEVHAIDECAELVKVFERYPLRAKKRHDFAIWKLAVAELQKPVDCRDPLMLDYYFCKIKEVRQYEAQEELSKPIVIDLQLTIKFEEIEESHEANKD